MKKKNAFIFMEVILISVVIMILFVTIYSEYNRINNNVIVSNKYTDIQKLYYVNEVRRFIVNENLLTLTTYYDAQSAAYIAFDCDNSTYVVEHSYCAGLLSKIGAQTVIISKYNTILLQDNLSGFNKKFQDYIKTLYYSDTETTYNSYYRLIIEFNDGDFSSLVLSEY